jgi:hypothetical protein
MPANTDKQLSGPARQVVNIQEARASITTQCRFRVHLNRVKPLLQCCRAVKIKMGRKMETNGGKSNEKILILLSLMVLMRRQVSLPRGHW